MSRTGGGRFAGGGDVSSARAEHVESVSGGHGCALCLDSCRARGAGGARGGCSGGLCSPCECGGSARTSPETVLQREPRPAPTQSGVYGDVLSSPTLCVPWEESFLGLLQYLSPV